MASSTARVARVAVCGLGRMGQIRARALQSHPRFNLVAVCDQDFELAHNHGAELDCKPYVFGVFAMESVWGTRGGAPHGACGCYISFGADCVSSPVLLHRFGHMSDALVTMGGDIDAFVVCTPTFSHLQLIRLGTYHAFKRFYCCRCCVWRSLTLRARRLPHSGGAEQSRDDGETGLRGCGRHRTGVCSHTRSECTLVL